MAALTAFALLAACSSDRLPTKPVITPPDTNRTPTGVVTRIEIAPGGALFTTAGEARALSVRAFDDQGHELTPPTVTWHSSDESVVRVDQNGVATAAATLGTAQITATSGSLTSAPMLAVIAQPAQGALLVADSQVVALTLVDSTAPFDVGMQYRVRLRGASPGVGQIVLASGGAKVGGRVVSVTPVAGDTVDATLEVVPLADLFTQLVINQTISLDNAERVPNPKVVALHGASFRLRDPSGAIHLDARGASLTGTPAGAPIPFERSTASPSGSVRYEGRNARVVHSSTAPTPGEIKFDAGPFECTATLAVKLTVAPLVLQTISVDVTPHFNLDFQYDSRQGGLQRLVVTGGLDGRILVDPRLGAALTGGIVCDVELATIIVPLPGPIGAVLDVGIPVGVSFSATGTLNFNGFGFDLFAQAGATASLGVDCTAGCQPVFDVSSNSDGSFKLVFPDPLSATFQAQIAATGGGFAKLAIVNPFLNKLRFEAFRFDGGLKQEIDLESREAQAADNNNASFFQLRPFVKAGTGSSVALLGKLLNITVVDASVEPKLPPIAHSPVGTFTISPNSVQAGDSTKLGDQATFTVTLDPVTYVGIYDVDEVEIRRQLSDGNGGFTMEPSRPGCTDLRATSGQTVFTCQTDFLTQDAGPQTFFAFVHARLFGIPIPVPLEIAANARGTLQVDTAKAACTTDSVPGLAGNLPNTAADSAAVARAAVVDNLIVAAEGTAQIAFPCLKRVTNNLGIVSPRGATGASVQFPALVSVGNVLNIEDVGAVALGFPALKSVGVSLNVLNNPSLTTVSFPVLASVGSDVSVVNNLALTTLRLPALGLVGTQSSSETASGVVSLTNDPQLATVEIPSVTLHAGVFSLRQPLSALTSLGGIGSVHADVFTFELDTLNHTSFTEAEALALANRGAFVSVAGFIVGARSGHVYPGPPYEPFFTAGAQADRTLPRAAQPARPAPLPRRSALPPARAPLAHGPR